MYRTACTFLAALVLASLAGAKLVEKTIDYKDSHGYALRGFLAYEDSKSGWRTGILVFHDWDGINDYEKMRCRQLAALGYVAFAPDVFGPEAKVETIPERQALTQKLYGDPVTLRDRAEAGRLAMLASKANVATNRVFAIGYCFGGGSALELARAGIGFRGVVTFHGTLATQKPIVKNSFQGKVLVLTGGADPFVPEEQVQAMRREFKNVGIDVTVVTYPGVGHAFTVPGSEKMGMKGVAYDEKADKDSWQRLVEFLKQNDAH